LLLLLLMINQVVLSVIAELLLLLRSESECVAHDGLELRVVVESLLLKMAMARITCQAVSSH
jgi:hypothetical protein